MRNKFCPAANTAKGTHSLRDLWPILGISVLRYDVKLHPAVLHLLSSL